MGKILLIPVLFCWFCFPVLAQETPSKPSPTDPSVLAQNSTVQPVPVASSAPPDSQASMFNEQRFKRVFQYPAEISDSTKASDLGAVPTFRSEVKEVLLMVIVYAHAQPVYTMDNLNREDFRVYVDEKPVVVQSSEKIMNKMWLPPGSMFYERTANGAWASGAWVGWYQVGVMMVNYYLLEPVS